MSDGPGNLVPSLLRAIRAELAEGDVDPIERRLELSDTTLS